MLNQIEKIGKALSKLKELPKRDERIEWKNLYYILLLTLGLPQRLSPSGSSTTNASDLPPRETASVHARRPLKAPLQFDWWIGGMVKRINKDQWNGYLPLTSDLHLFAPFLHFGPGDFFLQVNTLPTFLCGAKNAIHRNIGFFPNLHGGVGWKSQMSEALHWVVQGGADFSSPLSDQGEEALSRWGGEFELGGRRLWGHGFCYLSPQKKARLRLANLYGFGVQGLFCKSFFGGIQAYQHRGDSVQLATRMNDAVQLLFQNPWGTEVFFRWMISHRLRVKFAIGFESLGSSLSKEETPFGYTPYGILAFSFHPFSQRDLNEPFIPLTMKHAFLGTVLASRSGDGSQDSEEPQTPDKDPEPPEPLFISEGRPVGSRAEKIRLGISSKDKSSYQASGIAFVAHSLLGCNETWPLMPEEGVAEALETLAQEQRITFLLRNGKDAYFQGTYQGNSSNRPLVAPLIIKETAQGPGDEQLRLELVPLYPGNDLPLLEEGGLSLAFKRSLTWASPEEALEEDWGFRALFSFGCSEEAWASDPITFSILPKKTLNKEELIQYKSLDFQWFQEPSPSQSFFVRLPENPEARSFLLSTLFQISYGTESGEPLCFEWAPRSFTGSLSPSAVYSDPLLVTVSAEEKAAAVEEGVVELTLRFLESDVPSFHRFIASPITEEGCTEEGEGKIATLNLASPSEAHYLGLCPALESTPRLPFALAPQVVYQRSYGEEGKEDEIEILALYPGNGQELVQEQQMGWSFEQETSELHPVGPEEMVYHTASGEALSDYPIAGKAAFHYTLAEGSSLPGAPLTLHIQKEGEEARMALSSYQTRYGGRKYLLTGWDPELQQMVVYLYQSEESFDSTEAYQLYMGSAQGGAQALVGFSFVPWTLWIEEKRPVGHWSEKIRLGFSAEEKSAQQASGVTGVRYRLWSAHDRWPLEPETGVEETVEKSDPWQQIRFQLENGRDAYFQAAYQGTTASALLVAPLIIKETEKAGDEPICIDWIPLYPGNTLAWLRKEGLALQFEASLTWSPVEAGSEEGGFQALFSFVGGGEAVPEVTAPISLALWPKGSVNAQALEQYGALVFQLNQDASNPKRFSARLPANKEVEAFLLSTLFQISYGTESGEPLCFEWAPRSFTRSLSPSSVYTDPLLVKVSAEEKAAAVEEGVVGLTLRFLESDLPSLHRFIASPITEEGCTEEAEGKIAALNLASPSEARYLGLCSASEESPKLPFVLAPQVVYQRSYGEEGKEDEIEILALYPGNGQELVQEKQMGWSFEQETSELHPVAPEEMVYHTASGEALSDYPIAGKAVFHYTLAEGSSLPEAPLTLHIQKEGEEARMVLSNYQTSYGGRKYLLTGWDPETQQLVLYLYQSEESVDLTEAYQLYMGSAQALSCFSFVPWILWIEEKRPVGRWSEKMRLGLSAEEKNAQQASGVTGVRYRLWGAHDCWPLAPETGVEETVETSDPWQQIRFQLENGKDAYFQAAYQGTTASALLVAPLIIKETEKAGDEPICIDWIPLYPGNTLAWLREEGLALQFEAGLTWSPVEAGSEEWGFQALFSFVGGSEAVPEIAAPISLALWPKGSVNAQALEQYGALVFQLNQDASNPKKFSARLPANKEVEAFLLSTLFQISYGTESGEPLCFEWAPRSFTRSLSPSSVYTDPLLVTVSAEEKAAAVEEGVVGLTLRFLESDLSCFHRFIASPITEEGCTEEAEGKIATLNLASPSEARYLGLCPASEESPKLPFVLAPQVVYQRSYGEDAKEDEIEILALYPGNGQELVQEQQMGWSFEQETSELHPVAPEEMVYHTASGEALSDYPIAGKAVFHYTLAEGSSLPEAPLTLHIQKEGEEARMVLSNYQTRYGGRKYLLTGWDPEAQRLVLYLYQSEESVDLTEAYQLYMGSAQALSGFSFVPWILWIEEKRPVGRWSEKMRLGLSAEEKSAQQASGVTGVRYRLWGAHDCWPLAPETGVEETVEKSDSWQQMNFHLENGKDAYFQAAYQGTTASALLVAPLIIKETEKAGDEPICIDWIPLYPGNTLAWLRKEGLALQFEAGLTWSPVEADPEERGFQALFSFVGGIEAGPEITAPISLALWPKGAVNAQALEQYGALVFQLYQDASNPQRFSARLPHDKASEAFLLSTLFQISYGTESGEPLCFEWAPRSFTQSLSPSSSYTDPLLVTISAEEKKAAVEEGVVGFTLRFLETDASSFHHFIASPTTEEACTEGAEGKIAALNLASPSEARYLGLFSTSEPRPKMPLALAPQVVYQRSYGEEAKEDEIEILALYSGNGKALVKEKQISWTFEKETAENHRVTPEEAVYHTASGEALSDYPIAGKAVFHCTLTEGSSLPGNPLTLHIQKEGEEARMALSSYQTRYGGRKYLLTGWDLGTQQVVLYLYKKGEPIDLTETYQLYMESPQGGAQALSCFSFVDPWLVIDREGKYIQFERILPPTSVKTLFPGFDELLIEARAKDPTVPFTEAEQKITYSFRNNGPNPGGTLYDPLTFLVILETAWMGNEIFEDFQASATFSGSGGDKNRYEASYPPLKGFESVCVVYSGGPYTEAHQGTQVLTRLETNDAKDFASYKKTIIKTQLGEFSYPPSEEIEKAIDLASSEDLKATAQAFDKVHGKHLPDYCEDIKTLQSLVVPCKSSSGSEILVCVAPSENVAFLEDYAIERWGMGAIFYLAVPLKEPGG